MSNDLTVLREDLAAEQRALDDVVSSLAAEQWQMATPSPGWSVRDQLGHLTYFDGTAALAVTNPDGFTASLTALVDAASSNGIDEFTLGAYRAMTPSSLLDAWRSNRTVLLAAAATLSSETRVPWYGPSMGAKSFLTARLMEVWAHGTDIVDAVGASRVATDRLRHIAQLGFITRGWSYRVRGLPVPDEAVRVELQSPSGATWNYGPDDATDVVSGPAEAFCLVVTQRRHIDDTSLRATGFGRDWMLHAQAFAGGPTEGPTAKGSS